MMKNNNSFLTKNRKGVSTVVATLLIIMLSLVAVAIVWSFVNQFVKSGLEESGSCFGILEKVNINNRYTCYNSSSNELLFSISIGDVEVDELLVAVEGDGTSITFKIYSEETEVENVVSYPNRETSIKLPSKNAGLTYILNLTGAGLNSADSIEIAPIIGNNQCRSSDSLTQIDSCTLLDL